MYVYQGEKSIEVFKIPFAIKSQRYSARPLRKVLAVKLSLDILFIHFPHILGSNIKKSISLILQTLLNQPIMIFTNMPQIYPFAIPRTKLTDLPECNRSDGVSSHISSWILAYPFTHLNHGRFLVIIYMSFLAYFEHNMFGLYHRLERNIVAKNGIHLFIDISPFFQRDGHLFDYVELLEIVSFLETDSL